MLHINDYIYHFINGIGIVKEINGSMYNVRFKNKTLLCNESELSGISNDLIDNILNSRYEEFYDQQTLRKGLSYFENGNVNNAVVMDKNVSGIVSGNEDYFVNINFSKNTIRTKCSCPVGILCKHTVAILEYVSDNVLSLSIDKKDVAVESSLSLDAINLIAKLDDWNKRNEPFLEESIEFCNYLKDKDSSFYEAMINYLNKNYRNKLYGMNVLKRIIIFNDEYYSRFMNISKSALSSNFGSEIRRLRETSMSFLRQGVNISFMRRYGFDVSFPFYVTNNEYELLYKLILSTNSTIIMDNYLPIIFKYLPITSELIDLYIDNVNNNYSDSPMTTKAILSYLNEEDKSKLYDKSKYLSINSEYLKNISYNKQIELLLNQKLNNDLGDYIIDKFYTFKEFNPSSAINLLFKLGYSLLKYRSKAVSLLKDNKYTEIFVDYLKPSNYEYDYSNDLYYQYIDYDYDINEINNNLHINYYIVLGGIKLFVCYKTDNSKYLITEKNYASLKEISIASKIEELEDFKNNISLMKNKIKKKQQEFKRKQYESAILDFEEGIGRSELVLATRNKMVLEVSISKPLGYGEGYTLSLRTGNDKLYVVKDVIEFLDACKSGIVLKYGKGLEFNHQIDNFSENARNVLSYLLSLPYSSFQRSSRKDLLISNNIFSGLLDVLKDNKIYFFENELIVRLALIEPILKVDNEYRLSSSIDDMELLDLGDLFIIDKKNGYIDRIKGNNKELKLYKFFYDNQGMDVSVVKQMFIDSIYSRFINKIEIAEEITNDFYMTELSIEVYFDYQDQIITSSVSYFKDGNRVSEYELSQAMERARVNVFNNYLASLGFIDNKLIDEADIYSFFMMDFERLKELATVYLSESITNKTIAKLEAPNVRIQYNNSMMEMFLEESDYSEEELYEIYNSLKRKKKFALLKDNRIIDLDNDNGKEMLSLIDDLNLNPKRLLSITNGPIYQSFKAYAHKGINNDEYLNNMMNEIIHFKDSIIEIPDVNAKLRDYQKDGYRWLSLLSKYNLGGILADDMGLGKTLEMITLIKSDNERLPSLIVCPKSLVFNWISEFHKFDSDIRVINVYGSSAQRRAIIRKIANDEKVVYITGYDSLRMDIEEYQGKMFNYLILDEAQAIKNVHAEKSKSVKSLDAIHRFALTGTPIENSVIDLWSIFDFIMPGYFPELGVFKSRYEQNDEYTKNISLKSAPFILRRTKEDVLKDLPPKFERIISADMSIEQRKIYDSHILDAKKKMEAGLGAFEMLPYLTRLRQICVDPSLFLEGFSASSGKMKLLKMLLDEYISLGHRILLFSSFVGALEIVEEYLKCNEINYLKITGDTKSEDRLNMVNDFNNDENYKVFLISLKAGGTGLNLTGADTVIHLDPWWNVSAENQATDRAHRIGQKRNVEVIKLVCEDSIEQKVIELQNLKKNIIDKIISKNDSSITGLSLDDLKYILE